MILDALIVGGGPSGATAATLLARRGMRVAVAEKAEFPRRKVCGEYISATTWPILEELGIAESLAAHAGPAVQRVGFYARNVAIDAPMPAPAQPQAWGRAIGREILDAALLDQAARAGARVMQPAVVESIDREGDVFSALIHGETLQAKRVVLACGSWERGPFTPRMASRPSDLLGFKARFANAALAPGLMPLVLFPGGYGGLVHTDGGEVSFSCCIRRDVLSSARHQHRGSAGEAVLAHAMAHGRAIRETLGGAERIGPWLSAGPIRPGIRRLVEGGLIRVGNAAGEAHPLVAEGISMAIQSAWLLARHWDDPDAYARAWRETFAARIRASSLFAALTVPPLPSRASIALLQRSPRVLTWGARWSGKARTPQPRAA